MIGEQDIIAYYDECEVDYKIVWHLRTHMAMHYGYWEPWTRRLRQALHNMNLKLAEFGQIQAGSHVLDAGCGVGSGSFFLSGHHHCSTEGITLSALQVEKAYGHAATLGLENTVRFSRQDFCNTDFPNEHFDYVWAMESVCHANDKSSFLQEAYRILKPGGKLIMADFFRVPFPSPWLQKWANSWAVPDYATLDDFSASATSTGFMDICSSDVTPHVLPSIRRLYYCFFPGIVITTVGQWLGLRTNLQTLNTWSTLYQYKSFKAGDWHYLFFSATKPDAAFHASSGSTPPQ